MHTIIVIHRHKLAECQMKKPVLGSDLLAREADAKSGLHAQSTSTGCRLLANAACFLAPLGRLELSLSAPEADALSTELQGQRKKILPQRPSASRPHARRQRRQFASQRLDQRRIASFVTQLQ